MSMEMRLIPGQYLRPVLSLRYQQAISLVQATIPEIAEILEKEREENPVLVEADGEGEDAPAAVRNGDGGDQSSGAEGDLDWDKFLRRYADAPPISGSRSGFEELPPLEDSLTRQPSLRERLMEQLRVAEFDAVDFAVATLIVGNLDEDGYLKDPPLEEIAADAGCDLRRAERVLRRVQTFDPVGVAARSLVECLLVQARERGIDDDLVVRMIEGQLPALKTRNYEGIARALGQPVDEIELAAREIQSLDPWPGRVYAEETAVGITPEVFVHKVEGKYLVVCADDGLPRLRISKYYERALSDPRSRAFIKEKLRRARWLLTAIDQRRKTIREVAEQIVEFQRDFFDNGGPLRPLKMQDVALRIHRHESTVSRATTRKYVHTPRGTFELKHFFSAAITRANGDAVGSRSVKERIATLIRAEDPRDPLSDQGLVELLAAEGVRIARRTVAKYREQLKILGSAQRRRAD